MLNLVSDGGPTEELGFLVTSVDPRFRRVLMDILGDGLSGSIEAFSRTPPVLQPPMDAIENLVATGEFKQAVALVVGGSRGLGEITAKLVAAGGGRVIITYASGMIDAERIAAEISRWGGICSIVGYDTRQNADSQLTALKWPPTHVYYFATPTISRRKADVLVRERLDEFNEFYVHGFLRLVDAALRLRPSGISAFYPSTIYVQNRPAEMTEYAMAKAAGEILCADIPKYRRGVRILMRRLPRVATDQTMSLIPVQCQDPLSVMLPIIREMHQSGGGDEASSVP